MAGGVAASAECLRALACALQLLTFRPPCSNSVRLHQKVNSQRWYWFADSLGVVLFQDMIQKFGAQTDQTVPLFMADFASMIDGLRSHPSVIQWVRWESGSATSVSLGAP